MKKKRILSPIEKFSTTFTFKEVVFAAYYRQMLSFQLKTKNKNHEKNYFDNNLYGSGSVNICASSVHI